MAGKILLLSGISLLLAAGGQALGGQRHAGTTIVALLGAGLLAGWSRSRKT